MQKGRILEGTGGAITGAVQSKPSPRKEEGSERGTDFSAGKTPEGGKPGGAPCLNRRGGHAEEKYAERVETLRADMPGEVTLE